MRKVQRSEIVDYQTYNDRRTDLRPHILAIKGPRRIHVGPHLTFLFENADTIRYQIQEMMRTERIVLLQQLAWPLVFGLLGFAFVAHTRIIWSDFLLSIPILMAFLWLEPRLEKTSSVARRTVGKFLVEQPASAQR